MTSPSVANRVFTGSNPFDVPLGHYDHLARPDPADPDWSETHFWSLWDPAAGTGVLIHVGVDTEDKDLWWAQVFAYLPGGLAAADMSWGRAPKRLGPATGNFSARCVEPLRRWRLSFDGAAQVVDGATMATTVLGAAPAVPMRFELELVAAMPVWDLYKAVDLHGTDVAGVHHEQVMTGQGSLHVGGEHGGDWRLDGCGFRNHSYGSRDVRPFGGDHLIGAHFPASGRSLQLLSFWDKEGTVFFRTASIHQGDEIEVIADFEMTGLERGIDRPRGLHDLTGEPRVFDVHLPTNAGSVTVGGQVLHVCNTSLIGKNTNLNGSAIGLPGDPLLIAQSQVKLTWPDGDVGYGFFERTYKKSLLTSALAPRR